MVTGDQLHTRAFRPRVFDSCEGRAAANSMQIAEIQFFGDVVPGSLAVLDAHRSRLPAIGAPPPS